MLASAHITDAAKLHHRHTRSGMLGGVPLARARQLLAGPRLLYDVGLRGKPHRFGHLVEAVADPNNLDSYKAFVDSQFDPRVTWMDIEWLRSRWPGQLITKGVLCAADAAAD